MENLEVPQFRTKLTSQNLYLQTRSLLPWCHLRASHSRSTSSTGRWRRRNGAPLNPARMLALLWLRRFNNCGMLSVLLHWASSGSCTVVCSNSDQRLQCSPSKTMTICGVIKKHRVPPHIDGQREGRSDPVYHRSTQQWKVARRVAGQNYSVGVLCWHQVH